MLAQVHKAVAAVTGDDDLDMDPALAACVHLHAATTVDGSDRKQLERVCRDLLRPPLAKP